METIRSPRYLVKLNDAIFYQGYKQSIGKVLFQYNLVEQVHRQVDFNINHAPTAQHDTATTFENQAIDINVVENDSDEDSDNLSLVSVNSNSGSVEIINETTIQFIPEQNFLGTVEIEYVISDNHQARAKATVTVTVVANQAPVAVNDSVETAFNTQVEIDVLANDSDPENDMLTIVEASASSGDVAIIDKTKIIYTPVFNFSGTVDIEYVISDEYQQSIAIATVTVVANQAPVAVNDSVETAFNTLIEIDVLANDSDPENDMLTIVEASVSSGNVAIIDNIKLAYTPVSNFSGTVDIEYTIADAFGNNAKAKVTVTVNPAIVVLKPKPVSSGEALNIYFFILLWAIASLRLYSRRSNNF